MKKTILIASILFTFVAKAQQQNVFLVENHSEPKTKAVLSVISLGGSTSAITVSGSSTIERLKEIEKLAKEYDIDIKFTNEKYNRNKLEYIELSYLTNQKWETLTFGTDDLRLLPFDLSFKYSVENDVKTNKILTLKNNKNNRKNPAEEIIIQII